MIYANLPDVIGEPHVPDTYTRPVFARQAIHTQKVESLYWTMGIPFASMNYKKECGKRLRAAREAKGFTLEILSKRVSGLLSPSRISNYEQGERQIGIKEALALYPILGVQPAYLLCVDVEEGDMTPQETNVLRNFRALPEKDRNDYDRRLQALALVYVEPVPDERQPSPITHKPRRRSSQK